MSNLKIIRAGAGLTVNQLAEKSGVSIPSVSNYDRGVQSLGSANINTINKLADALGLTREGFLAAIEDIDIAHDVALTLKLRRACKGAEFHDGTTTVARICSFLPEGAVERLDVDALREMMEVANRAYHAGYNDGERSTE